MTLPRGVLASLPTITVRSLQHGGCRFQSFEDRKWKVNSESKSALKSAMKEGRLHGELLDRRAKMKADRYCK